jgi:hypothetical protein
MPANLPFAAAIYSTGRPPAPALLCWLRHGLSDSRIARSNDSFPLIDQRPERRFCLDHHKLIHIDTLFSGALEFFVMAVGARIQSVAGVSIQRKTG